MVVENKLDSNDLNLSFEKLMMSGGVKMNMEGGSVNEWNDIPIELLLEILSLADHRTVIMATGVCNGWRDAISLGLTHLSLLWMKKNMNNMVLSLAPKLTNLQTLVLRQDKPQLEDNAVAAIANYCHDLQDLDLSKSFKLTDRSLYSLAHGCSNLTRLNISGCTAFSEEGVTYLTNFCRNLKIFNLCGCVQAASDNVLQAIGRNCSQIQTLNLGWCDNVGDKGVMSLAVGCPDLRALDLCGCVLITDDSVVALAGGCPHLRSLGLYYCKNITDRAMYSLAQSKVTNRSSSSPWQSSNEGKEGLKNLNISQCTALTPPAVQAVCDSFPSLHTCPSRHSLIISGCLKLTSVHCDCAFQARRILSSFPRLAH